MKWFGATSVLLVLLFASACRNTKDTAPEKTQSPTARLDIVEALRQDQIAERSRSDGKGNFRFDGEPQSAHVGEPGRWRFVFEAGPDGVAEDGWIFFQVSPFWGWSTPQVEDPEYLGFTTVSTDSEEVELSPSTVDQGLLAIQVRGGVLESGRQVRIDYGAEVAGAMPDRYAESRSCFFLSVDGDGDGIRGLVIDRPCLIVEAGPVNQMVLSLPSTARAGETVRLNIALLDERGNRGVGWSGEVTLVATDGLYFDNRVSLAETDRSVASVLVEIEREGVFRIEAKTADGFVAKSNPMSVSADQDRILWADLHGHSYLTDGTGTPSDYFRYARDVAALDVVALTDHDHWGMEPLAVHPELWEEIRRETELFHDPGRFITILGFEWTSWIHGHRHVLYFSGEGDIYDSVSVEFESPSDLWSALRGHNAMTFAHHSAGGPIATNWAFRPDPQLEPITEIVSVHGSSEAADSPGQIYSAVANNFVRDVLDRGYRLGFIGSGDSHDGHPGMAHLNAASGGLAAIVSDDVSRDGVSRALRARHTYATNGPRIVLTADMAGNPMGASIVPSQHLGQSGSGLELEVSAIAPGAIDRIEVILDGEVIEYFDCGRAEQCEMSRTFLPGDLQNYLYLRVLMVDGGAAWSSPFFFD